MFIHLVFLLGWDGCDFVDGNVYEKLGDIAKARSEWRKTLKVQINHSGAISKLGL